MLFYMFFSTFLLAKAAKLHISRQRYYKKCTYARKRTFFLEKKIDLSIYWSITYALGGSLLTRECIGDTSMSKLCLTFKKNVGVCSMGCISRTYFRGGRASLWGEVGVLEGTAFFAHTQEHAHIFLKKIAGTFRPHDFFTDYSLTINVQMLSPRIAIHWW